MRVRLLRESGGLGDVVRCLGIARAIRKVDPSAEIAFYSLPDYGPLIGLCPDVDEFVPVRAPERRRRDELPDPALHGYLRDGEAWDATVDLYCPAFIHEKQTRGRVTMDRITSWTLAAAETTGLPLAPSLPWLVLPERLQGRAEGWLDACGLRRPGRRLVGLQPFSVDRRRCWGDAGWPYATGKTIGWDDSPWSKLAEDLKAAGMQLLVFHSRREQGADCAKALGAGAALGVDLPLLAALVAACDAMVTVDSALYHVAAAVRTPAVGVFGITSGPLMCRFYPRHSQVSAGPAERDGLPCDSPCYAFRRPRGGDDCRGKACPALARVPPGRVAAEALRLVEA